MNAGLPPRPVRRLVLDPLFVPIELGLAAVLGALAGLAWLLSALCRLVRLPWLARGRVWRLAGLAAYYLLLDLTMLLGSFALWLRSPLTSWRGLDERRGLTEPGGPDEWRRQHTALLRWALERLMAASRRLLGFELVVLDRLPIQPDHRPPVLVLARHAGPGDSFTLVHLIASHLDRCPRVVLKAALQWDPGLDVLLNRLSCCFLPSRSGAGEDRTERLADLAAGLTASDALLLFPEGGNWTPNRHRRAVRRLWRAGRRRAARIAAENTHVLPPRPGGTLACLAARPDADVLIVAHAGLDTLVSPTLMWQALPLVDRPMTVGWWLVPAAELPDSEQARLDWLTEQWSRMDDWVASRCSADHPTSP
ncbi:MAG TPA: 1-acyl-sn-glycerol-3-phosphate acyltransferase [Jatrophihabitans sp.]|nr:1-acyl-sn-glycerol-3-phosphate acyltransferase [Jatrophihabitans sp.]